MPSDPPRRNYLGSMLGGLSRWSFGPLCLAGYILGLVPEDEICLVAVSGARPVGSCTLSTCRFRQITLLFVRNCVLYMQPHGAKRCQVIGGVSAILTFILLLRHGAQALLGSPK